MDPLIDPNRYRIPSDLPTPALLFFPDLIQANIQQMVQMVGGQTDRLRPHVKTVKCPKVVEAELRVGIRRHKCSTLAEAAMLARCGAPDVLVAYPLLGPATQAFVRLAQTYPNTTFRTVVDSTEAVQQLAEHAQQAGISIPVLIDLDPGLHRTGVPPAKAVDLLEAIQRHSSLVFDGLHCYDGHVKDPDPAQRRHRSQQIWDMIREVTDAIERAGASVHRLVCGGTPSSPFYAELDDPRVECSPGTCVLHDCGYGRKFRDLPFLPAALVMTRVISRPGPDLFCLDCGYKAIASDPPPAERFIVVGCDDAEIILQNEEHTVIRAPGAAWNLGQELLLCPTHICPTVALYDEAMAVHEDGHIEPWPITARTRIVERVS